MNVRRYPRPARAVALAVLACLGMTIWLTFGWGGDGVIVVVDALSVAPFAIYATVCSVLTARSARGRSRTAWTTMSIALAVLSVGELTDAFYALVLHRIPSFAPADAMYFAFSVLTFAAVLLLSAGQTVRSRVRLYLDCLGRRRGSVRAVDGHRRANLVPRDAP